MISKITIKDTVFLSVLAALLTITGMVTMPLVMTVTLFGVRNAAAAIFYGFFSVVAIMKVRKPGALTLLAIFNGVILLMMSPVMFLNNVTGALTAEIIGLLIFRSYLADKAAVFTAGLFIPLTLPSSIVFGMLMNGYSFSQIVEDPFASVWICAATIVLSYIGAYLGYRVCCELRRAGKLN